MHYVISCAEVLFLYPQILRKEWDVFQEKNNYIFLEIAFGSLNESMCQMELAFDLSYINEEELREIENKVSKLSRILSGWRRKLQEYINEQN